MKRISGLALASASLISLPLHAAAPDPAPTLASDAQGTTLSGAHHLNGAAFSLIVTDWWLSGTIANGQAQDVRLIVEVHLPQYPLLDRATDAAGRKLDVVILNRGPSARWPKKASERVAIVLPRDLAEKARTAGLSVTVSGKDRSFPIDVPADAMARFLDAYAQAAAASGASAAPAPQPAAPPPASTPPPPPSTPVVQASAAPAPVSTPLAVAQTPAAQTTAPQPALTAPPVSAPTPQPKPPVAPPAAAAPPPPDDNDPAITPVPDKRVRLPDGSFAPDQAPVASSPPPSPAPPPPAAAPSPPSAASAGDMPVPESGGGHGVWVDSLGLQFVATSSGAMVLLTRPGSIAAGKGIESGDFIEAVDGVPIKTLDAPQMAAKIGAPGVKVLHMIAAGDVRIR